MKTLHLILDQYKGTLLFRILCLKVTQKLHLAPRIQKHSFSMSSVNISMQKNIHITQGGPNNFFLLTNLHT